MSDETQQLASPPNAFTPDGPDDPNQYPAGWDYQKSKQLADHYGGLAGSDWDVDEDAPADETDFVSVRIPRILLPAVESMVQAVDAVRGSAAATKKAG